MGTDNLDDSNCFIFRKVDLPTLQFIYTLNEVLPESFSKPGPGLVLCVGDTEVNKIPNPDLGHS